MKIEPVAELVLEQMAVGDASSLRVKWLIDGYPPVGTKLYTHPVKDREADRLRFSDEPFNRWLDESISDSGHTVYDLVENVCEAWHGWENSQYYTHPVKELHLSFQKSKQTGELLAVTYTDDEHRIVEVLWERPPAKEQDTDCQYC